MPLRALSQQFGWPNESVEGHGGWLQLSATALNRIEFRAMTDTVVPLHLFAIYGAIICLAIAELVTPRRPSVVPIGGRWLVNIALFGFGLAVQRLIAPFAILVIAGTAESAGFGLLNQLLSDSLGAIVVGILLLDLWKYAEHRLIHRLSFLWRFHLVHHSDLDSDFTTTERHHPLEILLSMGGFSLVVYVTGIPPVAVAIYLPLATVVALLAHSNVKLPARFERWLGGIIVTPAVHSVHHSARREETDSNFGVLLTLWDRMFGTWRQSSVEQDAHRVIGLEYFRDPRWGRLDRVLWQPFVPANDRPK